MIFLNIFNQMSADLLESGLNETELKILRKFLFNKYHMEYL